MLLAIAGEGSLAELVRIRQVRRKRLYGRDGTVIEVSVDGVEVVQGDAVIERFAELELDARAYAPVRLLRGSTLALQGPSRPRWRCCGPRGGCTV